MRIGEVTRHESSIEGVLGCMTIDKQMFCVTLEPQFWENEKGKSCIPTGQYYCVRHQSPTHGETFQVKDVPNRTNILFHAGNTTHDTAGCIILGASVFKLRGQRAVKNSGKTFCDFMDRMKNERIFHLTIKEHY